LSVVVLLNSETLSPEVISNAALRCALGQDIPSEPPPAALVQLDAAQRGRVLGTYRITAETQQQLVSLGFGESDLAGLATVAVYEQDGSLLFQPVGQGPALMLATSTADFVLPSVQAALHFSFAEEAEQPATSVVVEQGGQLFAFER
jgi:hypothetical protein